MATPAGDDAVQGGDGGIGVNRVGDEVAERLSGVLVGDVEDLDGPAGCRDVELVVEGPDVVRVGGEEPVRRRGRGAEALALVAPGCDPQALFTPNALDFLAVEVEVTLPAQHRVGPPIAPAGMASGEPAQVRSQVLVGVGTFWPVALGGAVLANDLTRPSLRRAHHFPEAISRRARFSSSLSATRRFSWAFSFASSFSRLASSAFIPPY